MKQRLANWLRYFADRMAPRKTRVINIIFTGQGFDYEEAVRALLGECNT